MGDASDAFASPVERRVGGEVVEFPRIVGREYGVLESAVREKLAAVDRELLDECEIVGKERFDKLRESAARPVTLGHVEEALLTHEFARKALAMSLKKAGRDAKDAEAVIDQIPPVDACQLARVLVGFLVPFDQTKLVQWHGLAAAIRRHFPGTDPADLTLGQMSHLLAVAKADAGAPQ